MKIASRKSLLKQVGETTAIPNPSGIDVLVRNNETNVRTAKYSLNITAGLTVLLIIMAGIIYQLIMQPPTVAVVAMDEKGSVVELHPLFNPLVTDAEVVNWATKRVVELKTYTFNNWKAELQRNSKHFLDESFENYLKALDNSKLIKQLTQNKWISSAIPTRAPVIVKKTPVNGIYTWTVSVPITMTLEGGASTAKSTNLNVRMVIQRVPRNITIDGIKIRSYLEK